MDTKQINEIINKTISAKEFEELQDEVVNKIFKDINNFPFESDDDVRLVAIRIQDKFVAGLNYRVAKHMISLMGFKSK